MIHTGAKTYSTSLNRRLFSDLENDPSCLSGPVAKRCMIDYSVSNSYVPLQSVPSSIIEIAENTNPAILPPMQCTYANLDTNPEIDTAGCNEQLNDIFCDSHSTKIFLY